jgi:CysZ protein
MELLWTVPIFFLGLIPVIGLIAPILLFCMQAYYAGFGNMDYTLERHFGYSDSIRFVKRNRGSAIGNGLVFMTVLIIPIVGLILVLPLSVTAASLRTVQLMDKEQPKLIDYAN